MTFYASFRRVFGAAAVVLVACVSVVGGFVGVPLSAGAGRAELRASYLVQFADGVSPRAAAEAVTASGGRVAAAWSHVGVGVAADLPVSALAGLTRNPLVRLVAPDGPVSTGKPVKGGGGGSSPPSGSLLSRPAYSWGQDRIDQRALPLDGKIVTASAGAGVRAYIVDTGVLADHTEFGGRVGAGFTAIDDGSGTNDCNWHGTHVAGTVAGAGYGVAPAVTVVPVRVLGCDGSGTWSQVIAGLDWVVANHPAGTPGVVNMSLGGGANDVADAAVSRVFAAGLTVVVSAGNDSADACSSSPARVPEAITVAAISSDDLRAPWSNWGACVDVFAPGDGIASASIIGYGGSIGSGTSMAAPHVAGAVAILAAQRPTATPDYFVSNLLGVASTGLVVDAGTGTPNRLLFVPTSPPPDGTTQVAAPTGVSAVGGKNKVTVSWASAAGADSVTVNLTAAGVVVRTVTVAAGSLSAAFNSVPKGSYGVTVSAQTAWGGTSPMVTAGPVTVTGR